MRSFILLGLLFLAGCSSVKTALGVNKSVPDEFAVVTRAPLTLPPNYALQPPKPGTQRPQELTSYQQAQQVLSGNQQNIGQNIGQNTGQSNIPNNTVNGSAEQALLQRAGASQTNQNIREIVDGESVQQQSLKDAFLQKPTANTQTVDALKERQRLQQSGVSQDNEVPSVTVKPAPWWQRIF